MSFETQLADARAILRPQLQAARLGPYLEDNSPLGEMLRCMEFTATVQQSCNLTNNSQHKFLYSGLEHFTLMHGAAWTPAELPLDIPVGEARMCFKNAFELVMGDPRRYHYVEGYASGYIPVHHAWAVDQQGRVVDPTWSDRRPGNPVTGRIYVGTSFNFRYVVNTLNETKQYSVLDQWMIGWPILTGKHDLTEAINVQAYRHGPNE